MSYLMLMDRWALAVVLVASAIAKLGLRTELLDVIRRYQVVPERWVSAVAWILPRGEFTLALALASGVFPLVASAMGCLVFALFALVVARNLLRGQRFDCGCGTVTPRSISWRLVATDTAYAGLAAVLVFGAVPGFSILSGAHASASQSAALSLPVPLVVILAFATARLALVCGSVRRPPRPLGRQVSLGEQATTTVLS